MPEKKSSKKPRTTQDLKQKTTKCQIHHFYSGKSKAQHNNDDFVSTEIQGDDFNDDWGLFEDDFGKACCIL